MKGIIARFEQGLWPYHAPIGYVDNGPGKTKTIDVRKGSLVREAFTLYATGAYSLASLASVVNSKGLRNSKGGPVDTDMLSKMFHNPFYIGKLPCSSKIYPGIHEPLISVELFEKVSRTLVTRRDKRNPQHRHLFSVTFRCAKCRRYIIAEKHKGHKYYRCHTRDCLRSGFREELIKRTIAGRLVTVGKSVESAAVEAGDLLKIREIISKLSGTISFGNADFTIDPQPYPRVEADPLCGSY